MRRLLNAIKIFLYQQPLYYRYYKKLNIKENVVLLESTHGKTFGGHLFYLAKELTEQHPHLKLYVVSEHVDQIRKFLEGHELNGVHLVRHLSRDYLRLLASAKYLLNDSSFYSFFIKKSGQIYFNFWHGTPLKTLGKHMENITDAANVQRNFYMADKLIVSNEFLANTLADAYGLNGIYQGEVVIAPAPRNGILLNTAKRDDIRQKLAVNSKKVLFYMPTWRGNIHQINNDHTKMLTDLRYLSANLSEETLLYVKLHPFAQRVDLTAFENVFEMPFEYELYEFLTAVDVLITDYSSIMYDFVLANRKIILYMYDKDEYFSTRGVYDDINRYPFVQVNDVHQLLIEIQDAVAVDYCKMSDEFCPVDCVNGAQIVSDYLFKNVPHERIKATHLFNGKETAFVLGGGFWDNGVTTVLLNTFDNIDLDRRNYVVLLGQKQLKKEYEFRVRNLSDKIIFYPFPQTLTAGAFDRFLYLAYMKFEWFDLAWIQSRVANVVKDDYKRIVGDLKVDHFVHFTGFGNRYSELIKQTPDEVNTVMYVHTDMMAEYEAKKNFSKKIVFSAYEKVDKITLVNGNMKEGLVNAVPMTKDKLHVVNNFLGEKRIRGLAEADMLETLVDVQMEHGSKASLISDVNHPEISIFVNIGRFDYQKGHDRLIAAFEAVYKTNPNVRLVIVAPHGPLKEQTLALVSNSLAKSGIYILGRMSNPYALLAACDCFVLSSHYEGLVLVIYEALAVNIAVVTVDIKGATTYLNANEAIITPNSVEGLIKGMQQYLAGYSVNQFDFSIPKEQSKIAFERLFIKE